MEARYADLPGVWAQVAVGGQHAVLVTRNGKLYEWGAGVGGRLLAGAEATSPERVPTLWSRRCVEASPAASRWQFLLPGLSLPETILNDGDQCHRQRKTSKPFCSRASGVWCPGSAPWLAATA